MPQGNAQAGADAIKKLQQFATSGTAKSLGNIPKASVAPAPTVPSSAPSQSFLQRMFGDESFSPTQQQGIDIARKEMPGMAPVQPYGFFSRLLSSGNNAYAGLGGDRIYMNTQSMAGHTPEEVADTLTHEQTHINQQAQRGYGPTGEFLRNLLQGNPIPLPYGQRPDEMEAFQAERQRQARMGRMPSAYPSFTNPGQWTQPAGDINLPYEGPKSVAPSPAIQQRMMGPVTTPTGPAPRR